MVLLSVVGKTANNLALLLLMATGKVRVLGTTVDAIDTAEDRFRFNELCDILGIDQPKWQAFRTIPFAHADVKFNLSHFH